MRFTPNKQVNHINVVEEHRMIIKSWQKYQLKNLVLFWGYLLML